MPQEVEYSENDLKAFEAPTVRFGWQTIYSLGTKKLPIRVEEKYNSQTIETTFLIIDILMTYNVILECLTLNTIKVVVAPYLLLMQFELDDRRVGKLYGDQKPA